MKIAFWSPPAGQSGRTTAMLAAAYRFASKTGKRVLLIPGTEGSSFAYAPREKLLREGEMFGDNGLTLLLMSLKNFPATAELFEDASTELLAGSLYLLGDSGMKSSIFTGGKNRELLEHLPDIANDFYDYVFYETGPETGSSIDRADCVAVVVRQSPEQIKMALGQDDGKKRFFFFGEYTEDSVYRRENLVRMVKRLTKENSGVIPFSGMIFDANVKGELVKLLSRYEECDRDYADAGVFREIFASTDRLMDYCGAERKDR